MLTAPAISGAAAWFGWDVPHDRRADHPAWLVLPLSALAWLFLVLQPESGAIALCHAPASSAVGSVTDRLQAAWRTGALGLMLLGWMVMTVAMMLPRAGAMLRHVAGRSFAARRRRAAAEFLAGYLAAWTLLGVLLVPLAAAAPGLLGGACVPAAGFLLAAAWQCTAAKRLALLRCHRTGPLSPWGWHADRDCLGFGLAHGKDCAASCWAMMLACMLASHALLPMLCVQAIAASERRARVPALHRSALALAGCGVLAAALALGGLSPS